MQTVTQYLDIEHHIAIAETMQLFPTSFSLAVEPAVLGQYDAETGVPCQPYERGYRTLADMEAYIIAYDDTMALIERDADTDEYEDWQLDVEWIRNGC